MVRASTYKSFVDLVTAQQSGQIGLSHALALFPTVAFPNGEEQNDNHVVIRKFLYDLSEAVYSPFMEIADKHWVPLSVSAREDPILIVRTLTHGIKLKEYGDELNFFISFHGDTPGGSEKLRSWPGAWVGVEITGGPDITYDGVVRASVSDFSQRSREIHNFLMNDPGVNYMETEWPDQWEVIF